MNHVPPLQLDRMRANLKKAAKEQDLSLPDPKGGAPPDPTIEGYTASDLHSDKRVDSVAREIKGVGHFWAIFDEDGGDGRIVQMARQCTGEILAKEWKKHKEMPITVMENLFLELHRRIEKEKLPGGGGGVVSLLVQESGQLITASMSESRVFLAQGKELILLSFEKNWSSPRDEKRAELAGVRFPTLHPACFRYFPRPSCGTRRSRAIGYLDLRKEKGSCALSLKPKVTCWESPHAKDRLILISPRAASHLPIKEIRDILEDTKEHTQYTANTLLRASMIRTKSDQKEPLSAIHQLF